MRIKVQCTWAFHVESNDLNLSVASAGEYYTIASEN